MGQWKCCRLKDIGTIVGGGTPSTKIAKNYNGKIGWITPKDLAGFSGRYIKRGQRSISSLGLASSGAKMLPSNTVLFSSRAPIGYIAIAECELSTNQGFKSVIPNEKVDPLFLYYLLKYNVEKIKSFAGGSTFLEVSKKVMEEIEVYIPVEVEEQKKIAKILGSIDDKIELNLKINNNLEQQAKTLYKTWFIDFKPFSNNGIMPQKWKVGTIAEIVEFHDSKRIPLSKSQRDNMKSIYPYYGATSIMDHVDDFLFDGVFLLLGEDGTVTDNNGFPILQYVNGKFWVNNHAHILSGKSGFSVEMLYLLFSLTNIQSIVTGAVQPKVNQTNLKNLCITIPPKEILKDFDMLIQPLFTQIRILKEETSRLIDLREFLLPKLLSGDFHFP